MLRVGLSAVSIVGKTVCFPLFYMYDLDKSVALVRIVLPFSKMFTDVNYSLEEKGE